MRVGDRRDGLPEYRPEDSGGLGASSEGAPRFDGGALRGLGASSEGAPRFDGGALRGLLFVLLFYAAAGLLLVVLAAWL